MRPLVKRPSHRAQRHREGSRACARRPSAAGPTPALRYPLWLSPASNYLALGFLALVLGVMAYHEDTRIALLIGPAFVVLLSLIYWQRRKPAVAVARR